MLTGIFINFAHHFIEAKRGRYIYFEAFHHNNLYFIEQGHIRLGYIDEAGREVIKDILSQGELFGQITLERNSMNGEFAQAYRGTVSLFAFNIQDFQKILHAKPDIAIQYSRMVGNKLRVVQNRMINLLNKDVMKRLIQFFWQLLQSGTAEQTTGSIAIQNYFTHNDIAHLIGCSRQTITTVINELASQGILTCSRQQIFFPDPGKISKLANSN